MSLAQWVSLPPLRIAADPVTMLRPFQRCETLSQGSDRGLWLAMKRLCGMMRWVVRRGQYLERAVVVVGEPALEGLYHRGSKPPAVLIVPPHPEEGSMETPKVAELGWALARAGCATLRFNWRGVGASGGELDWDKAAEDLEAAREQLAESAFAGASQVKTAAVGYGRGASVLWGAADQFKTIVLIQPRGPLVPRPDREVAVIESGDESDPGWRAAQSFATAQTDGRFIVISEADARFHLGLVQMGTEVVNLMRPQRNRLAYTDS